MSASNGRVERRSATQARGLGRKEACHPCRLRKLKCDGLRPICTNCSKPRIRQRSKSAKQLPPTSGCTWELNDGGDGNAAGPSGLVGHSETNHGTQPSHGRSDSLQFTTSFDVPPIAAYPPSSTHPSTTTSTNVVTPDFLPNTTQPSDTIPHISWDSVILVEQQYGGQPASIQDISPSSTNGKGLSPGEELAMQMFTWPSDLPSLEAVSHVLDVFFEKVPTWPKMLRPSAVKTNLSLSPLHPDFPARHLLHAILCITSFYLPDSLLSSRAYWPSSTPLSAIMHPAPTAPALGLVGVSSISSSAFMTPRDRFQHWHKHHALNEFTRSVNTGRQYLQALQSLIIITAVDQLNTSWADMWLHSGSCLRAAIPLRLYEAPDADHISLTGFSERMRIYAKSPIDQAEMDRTWWMAYLLDRSISVWTDRPVFLADEEITCPLPVLQQTYNIGFPLTPEQSLIDHNFYSSFPMPHQDPLAVYIKAVKLFSDTHRFFRLYQRRPHTVDRYRSEAGYHTILSQIATFRLAIPNSLRQGTPESPTLDRDLLIGMMYLEATTLILAMPLMTKETWFDGGAKAGVTAIRAVLAMVYELISTSYDLCLFPASFAYLLLQTVKGLIRARSVVTELGDTAAAETFSSEITVLKSALGRFGERFSLGKVFDKRVEELDRISGYHQRPDMSGQVPWQALASYEIATHQVEAYENDVEVV